MMATQQQFPSWVIAAAISALLLLTISELSSTSQPTLEKTAPEERVTITAIGDGFYYLPTTGMTEAQIALAMTEFHRTHKDVVINRTPYGYLLMTASR